MTYESLEKFSLRKINYVKTRTTILKTVNNLLREESFDDITVDEICQKAQISRGTFFNYFSTKDHVFHYFLRIFTIKIALRMKEWDQSLTFEQKLEKIYEWFKEEKQYPNFLTSFINFILKVGEEENEMKLIDAEFVYFFNGITEEEYSEYNELTIGKIFEIICKNAKAKGEIKSEHTEKELSARMLGVVTATYLSDDVNPERSHLEVFSKVI